MQRKRNEANMIVSRLLESIRFERVRQDRVVESMSIRGTANLSRASLSELTGRRRAQKLRRKTRLMEGEARDEGASAELSDMRRRGEVAGRIRSS